MELQTNDSEQCNVPKLRCNSDDQIALTVTGIIQYDGPIDPNLSQQNKEKKHKCEECGKWFSQSSDLHNHECLHIEKKSHKCELCGEEYETKKCLQKHIDMHKKSKRYRCKVCGERFLESRSLMSHIVNHGVNKRFNCEQCGKSFAHKKSLQSHIEHTCVTSKMKSLIEHDQAQVENEENANSDDGNLIAVKIKESASNVEDLCEIKQEIEEVADDYSGEIQSENLVVYLNPSEIKTENADAYFGPGEIQTENDDVYFDSDEIKTETVPVYLDSEDSLTIPCPKCGIPFFDNIALRFHMKTTHIEGDNVGRKCPVCVRLVKNTSILQEHLKMHSEKKYKCDVCGKEFRLKGNLTKHKDIHSEVKKYGCDMCGKRFSQKISLKRHTSNKRLHCHGKSPKREGSDKTGTTARRK